MTDMSLFTVLDFSILVSSYLMFAICITHLVLSKLQVEQSCINNSAEFKVQ